MKINIFSYVFWPENFLINELAIAWTKKNHQVVVQTSLPNYQNGKFTVNYSIRRGPYFERHENVDIYRYPVIQRRKNFFSLIFNYISNIVCGLINTLRLPKADVYFVFATSPLINALPAIILKKITGTPVVIWYQDLWPDSFFAVTKINPNSYSGQFINFFLKKIVGFIYAHTDLMLIQSPAFKEQLDSYKYSGKIEVLYNWASVSNLANTKQLNGQFPEIQELRLRNKFIFTFAGNIGRVQAIPEMIEAFFQLQNLNSDVHLIFVGDGSFFEDAKEIIKTKKIHNISFLGRKSAESMSELYNLSDVLVVALKDDPTLNKVIPSKIQSYMAAKKPILSFQTGAAAELIKLSRCGLVAAVQDIESFKTQVLKFQVMKAIELQTLGQHGYDFYQEHFVFEKALHKLEMLLQIYTKK